MTLDELDEPDPMLGRIVDSYEITRQLGLGGMGAVYEARHTVLNHRRAIKMLLPEAARGELAQRFIGEAKAAAAIDHPGIVRVDNIGTLEDGRSFIVMELLRGHDCSHLTDRGPQPLDVALSIVVQACSALHAAHEIGIIHRDLKPANLWLASDGRVKVLDFGIAKLSAAISPGVRTSSQMIAGTVGYLAPEQGRGLARVDRRADVFSLGVILFRLLTGRMPWDAMSIGDHVYLVTRHDVPIPDPAQFRSDLPDGWSMIIRSCLAADPAARPPTARVLAEHLVAASAPWGSAVIAHFAAEFAAQSGAFGKQLETIWPGPPPPQTVDGTIFSVGRDSTRPGSRRKLVPIAIGAAALAVLVAFAIVVAQSRGDGSAAALAPPGDLATAPAAVVDADSAAEDAVVDDSAAQTAAPIDGGAPDALEPTPPLPEITLPAPKPQTKPAPPRPPRDTRTGRLKVVVTPGYANVSIDGGASEETPIVERPMPIGKHRVIVHLGNKRQRITVNIREGTLTEINCLSGVGSCRAR